MKILQILCFLFLIPIYSFSQNIDVTTLCSQSKIRLHRTASFTDAEQTENQYEYDVHFYGLDLDLDPNLEEIDGRVNIGLQVIGDSLDRIELNLTNNYLVNEVLMDNNTLAYQHQDGILTVFLGEYMINGKYLDLEVHYTGSPGSDAFNFDQRNGHPLIWSLSEPYGARTWWPCKDYPFDKADSATIKITVPEGLIVGSNGVLVSEQTENGFSTYTWKENYPITTYLISVAAYPYQLEKDVVVLDEDSLEVVHYIFPDHFDNVVQDYRKTVDMIEFYSSIYGRYPFWGEKYGHAEFPWSGGMEHQTLTSILGPYEYLIAHELAHQWWGDMITCKDFHHIWLNEGFATYSEALWAEHTLGEEAYHDYMESNAYYGAGSIYVPDLSSDGRIFSGSLSYNKASWVLHMLRHVVGEQAFFDILKAYGNSSRKYGVATTEQFREICEQTSGMDLERFFEQWIYEENHPVYAYDWGFNTGNEGYEVDLSISQQQAWPKFKMPLDVQIVFENGDTTIRVQNELQEESYQFVVDREPRQVVLDPDNWILKEIIEGRKQIQHNNGNMVISLADNGAIGFDQPNGEGNGLIFPSNGENLLYFGTSLIGSESLGIIDNDISSGKNGFKRKPGTNLVFNNEFDQQQGQIIFTENDEELLPDIEIEQSSTSYSDDLLENDLFLRYKLINQSGTDLEGMYFGLLLDADIGYYLDNEITVDPERKLIYQENGLFLGIMNLDDNYVLQLTGIREAISNFKGDKKFDYLSGIKNDYEANLKADWAMLLSIGPFDLAADESEHFSLVLIGGEDREGLLEVADEAQLFYDLQSGVSQTQTDYSISLSPNPASSLSFLRVQGLQGEELELNLLDVKGRILRSWKSGILQKDQTIPIDLSGFKEGSYVLSIRWGKQVTSISIIKN